MVANSNPYALYFGLAGREQLEYAQKNSMADAFASGGGIHNANFQALDRAATNYYHLPIDHFRAFNRALTAPEISSLFNDDGLVIP